MNHPIRIFALALTGLALTGCSEVSFLHPLADRPEDLATDVNLSGDWKAPGNDRWSFKQRPDGSYDMTWRNEKDRAEKDNDTLHFAATAVRISNFVFLDVASDDATSSIRGHSFARLRLEGDELQLEWLERKWIENKLTRERALPFESPFVGKDKRSYVVTARTPELQAFLMRHATDAAAFGEPDVLRRNTESQ